MPHPRTLPLRLLITSAAAAYAVAHVGWEHLDGGIRTHHLLARDDLPAVSNLWGLLVLPLLGWFASARLVQRDLATDSARVDRGAFGRAGLALVYGALLALGFATGTEALSLALFFGLFVLGIAIPLYRVEYVLGFVVGMTVTFGSVLPLLVSAVVMLASLALHPPTRWLVRAMRRSASAA